MGLYGGYLYNPTHRPIYGERNIRIFEDIWKTPEMIWDQLHFYVSFRAYYTDIFKPYPLSVIQLSWLLLCTP